MKTQLAALALATAPSFGEIVTGSLVFEVTNSYVPEIVAVGDQISATIDVDLDTRLDISDFAGEVSFRNGVDVTLNVGGETLTASDATWYLYDRTGGSNSNVSAFLDPALIQDYRTHSFELSGWTPNSDAYSGSGSDWDPFDPEVLISDPSGYLTIWIVHAQNGRGEQIDARVVSVTVPVPTTSAAMVGLCSLCARRRR